jgi:hypothetical protein
VENPPVYSNDDVLSMLDGLLAGRESDWWDGFYEDRAKPCPFFVASPDESLVHRRRSHVELVSAALKPGGWLVLTCFRPEGGSGYSDQEVYERRSLGGGLGYTEPQLRSIWSHGLEVRSVRPMRPQGDDSGLFGAEFLWAVLARKAASATRVSR